MKVCLEPGCWQPTPDTRCPECERAYRRVKEARYRTRSHRDLAIVGECVCCGATDDLCRDHVGTPLGTCSACGASGAAACYPPSGRRGCKLMGALTYQILCRPCNGSKGGKVMAGPLCPMHGGVVLQ